MKVALEIKTIVVKDQQSGPEIKKPGEIYLAFELLR